MTLLETVGPAPAHATAPTRTAVPVPRSGERTRLSLVPEPTAPSLADPGRLLELSASGSLMSLAIGTNMLNLTKFKVINMLPAFLVVPFALKLMGILGLS